MKHWHFYLCSLEVFDNQSREHSLIISNPIQKISLTVNQPHRRSGFSKNRLSDASSIDFIILNKLTHIITRWESYYQKYSAIKRWEFSCWDSMPQEKQVSLARLAIFYTKKCPFIYIFSILLAAILYKLKLGQSVTTIPTVGRYIFNYVP